MGTVWIAREVCLNGCDSASLECISSPAGDGDVRSYLGLVLIIVASMVGAAYFLRRRRKKAETL